MKTTKLNYKGIIRFFLFIIVLVGIIFAAYSFIRPSSISANGEIFSSSVIVLRAPFAGELQLKTTKKSLSSFFSRGTKYASIVNHKDISSLRQIERQIIDLEKTAEKQYLRTYRVLDSLSQWATQQLENAKIFQQQVLSEKLIAEKGLELQTIAASSLDAEILKAKNNEKVITKQVDQAAVEFANTEQLHQKKIIAEREFREAKSELAQIRLKQSNARIVVAELESEYELVERNRQIETEKINLKKLQLTNAITLEAETNKLVKIIKLMRLSSIDLSDDIKDRLSFLLSCVLRLSSTNFQYIGSETYGPIIDGHSQQLVDMVARIDETNRNKTLIKEQISLGYLILPQDCKLITMDTESGAHILPGDKIASFVPNGPLRFTALVNEKDYLDILSKTKEITVRFKSGQSVKGVLSSLQRSPSIRAVRDGLKTKKFVEIQFDLQATNDLPFGMTGTVIFHFNSSSHFFGH